MPRVLSPGVEAWRAQEFAPYDWLVESVALDIHWSYRELNAGGHTWEHRLVSISEIEESVPPGGGLAAVTTVTIEVMESDLGKSLRGIWNDLNRLEGADLTVALLPEGEAYADRLIRFTGHIDHASWRAGVGPGDGIGALTAVDDTLHRDIQLPSTVLTTDAFPMLPSQWQGAIIPLIYGSATGLGFAPLLLLDPTTSLYLAADHPMGTIGTVHAVAIAEGTRFLSVVGEATSDATAATMTLARPVTEIRYTISGIVPTLTHQVNVTNAGSLIDGNTATLAVLAPTTLNADGDGIARLAVKYTWPNPDGANTAILTVWNHRRTPGAAATVTAEVIVRSIHPSTLVIQRDNLFRDGPYRHQSNARTRELTISPLIVVTPGALEVELEVLNEGGAGAVGDTWEVAEFTFTLFYQAENLFTPVYLASTFEGRADVTGSITGVVGQTLLHAVDVLHGILTERLGLTVDVPAFVATRTPLQTYLGGVYRFDFGLGSGGWYRPQMAASEVLDTLAQQAKCYLFPRGDGSISINESRANPTSQLSLTVSTMNNVVVELSRLELVHSSFEVRYAWNVALGRFTQVAFANPGGCNHPGAVAADLLTKCADSFDRYGPLSPLIIEAYGIQDAPTADTLLQHLVEYFWTQQVLVTCETTFVAIHLEVGDYVTLTHPELPAQATGGVFEVVHLTTIPEVPDARPWPIRLTCLMGTLPSFDYFLIKDQSSVIWYWWINPAGEISWALAPPVITTRIAEDLGLTPIPYWIQVGGGGGPPSTVVGFPSLLFWAAIPVSAPSMPTRYVLPSTNTGEPQVVTTAPTTGTGYSGSPTLRGQGTGLWQLDVSEAEEVETVLV